MIKILIDSNIIISTVLFPNSITAQAFCKASEEQFHPLISDYIIYELFKVFTQKFPAKIPNLETFLIKYLSITDIIITPEEAQDTEQKIRDINDRLILRAAIAADCDLILTGDKDFLESTIEKPKSISVTDFLKL